MNLFDCSPERDEMERLCAEIEAHNRRYYLEDAPLISDQEFDVLAGHIVIEGDVAGVVRPPV